MLFTTLLKLSNNKITLHQQHFHNIKIFSKIAYKVSSRKFHELASKFDKN